METIVSILQRLKESFLYTVLNMDLFNYNAEDIIAQRDCSDFTRYWNPLRENCPIVKDKYFDTIKNDAEEIYRSLPENLHHLVAECICEDYRLIATYLIASRSNSDIAHLCFSYSQGEIPMLYFVYTDKSLEDAYWYLKVKVIMAQKRERLKTKK